MIRNIGSSLTTTSWSQRRTSEIYPPITTGMSHYQFYQNVYTKPKDFSKKCGQSSHEFGGKIPGLRQPSKKKRGRRLNNPN
jgi:hypothetical protein